VWLASSFVFITTLKPYECQYFFIIKNLELANVFFFWGGVAVHPELLPESVNTAGRRKHGKLQLSAV